VSWGHSFATVIPGFAIHIHPKASACTEMALQQPLESRSFFFFCHELIQIQNAPPFRF